MARRLARRSNSTGHCEWLQTCDERFFEASQNYGHFLEQRRQHFARQFGKRQSFWRFTTRRSRSWPPFYFIRAQTAAIANKCRRHRHRGSSPRTLATSIFSHFKLSLVPPTTTMRRSATRCASSSTMWRSRRRSLRPPSCTFRERPSTCAASQRSRHYGQENRALCIRPNRVSANFQIVNAERTALARFRYTLSGVLAALCVGCSIKNRDCR